MAKTISQKLAVLIGANTAELKRGMKEGAAHVHEFGAKVGEAFRFVREHALELIAGLLGVGLSVEHLHAVAEGIEHTAKAARRLEITVAELSALEGAARLAAIATQDFDGALETMFKNIGLAAQGVGKARKAFEDLRIDPKKLAELSATNQLKVLADALHELDDPARRAADAARIFGDQYQQVLEFVRGGATGIEEAVERFKELGGAFSDIDAAQVEAANDSLKEMKAVLEAIEVQLVVQLAPVVKGLADSFIRWSKQGMSWGEILATAIEWVGTGLQALGDIIDLGRLAWDALKLAALYSLKGILKAVEGLGNVLWKLLGGILPQSWADNMLEGVDGITDALSGLDKEIAGVNQDWDNILTSQGVGERLKGVADDFRRRMKEAVDDGIPEKSGPEPYDSSMLARVRGVTEQMKDQVELAEKIRSVNFQPNNLIRAGTAAAQAAPLVSQAKMMERLVNRQIDLENKQLKELEKISKNTAPADEEAFDG